MVRQHCEYTEWHWIVHLKWLILYNVLPEFFFKCIYSNIYPWGAYNLDGERRITQIKRSKIFVSLKKVIKCRKNNR